MTAEATVKTWANNWDEENAMEDDHAYMWRRMIETIAEPVLTDKSVLDFGCNQGGFLRELWKLRPFKSGVGVDIATESVKIAEERKPDAALSYKTPDYLDSCGQVFDLAFSHEVLYLLPDLAAHAATIKGALKPGGSYYAAIGCHTDNPQWDNWVKLISEYSNVTVQSYSPDDYARAFFDEGFRVTARPFLLDDFILIKENNDYFPKLNDSLDYHTKHKLLFRFIAPSA